MTLRPYPATPPAARLLTCLPRVQHTVGGGSPLISTSRRSLFPATTVMTFLLPPPLVSRWILGGSVGAKVRRGRGGEGGGGEEEEEEEVGGRRGG